MKMQRSPAIPIICAQCGAERMRAPSLIKGQRQFCDMACRDAWTNAQRPNFQCQYKPCGKIKQLPKGKTQQTYCSIECQRLARRTRVSLTCPMAGIVSDCVGTFTAEPNEIEAGKGKYCSRACADRGKSLERTVEVVCAREHCVNIISLNRTKAARRKYCSPVCRYGSDGPSRQTIKCAACGKTKEVYRYQLLAGQGRYCSRECHAKDQRSGQVTIRCRRCRKAVKVSPSMAGRQYCSRDHWLKSRRRQRFQCPVCGVEKAFPKGRKRTFCSGACRNRGVVRPRKSAPSARDTLIMECYRRGMKAPQIREALATPGMGGRPEWDQTSAVAIRQVIHRYR